MTAAGISRWMKAELASDPAPYLDVDGSVLLTQLGEAYANTHDLPEQIPDVVWDVAFKVGEWYAKAAR